MEHEGPRERERETSGVVATKASLWRIHGVPACDPSPPVQSPSATLGVWACAAFPLGATDRSKLAVAAGLLCLVVVDCAGSPDRCWHHASPPASPPSPPVCSDRFRETWPAASRGPSQPRLILKHFVSSQCAARTLRTQLEALHHGSSNPPGASLAAVGSQVLTLPERLAA